MIAFLSGLIFLAVLQKSSLEKPLARRAVANLRSRFGLIQYSALAWMNAVIRVTLNRDPERLNS
jgi:hypothetical protein